MISRYYVRRDPNNRMEDEEISLENYLILLDLRGKWTGDPFDLIERQFPETDEEAALTRS